MKFFLALIVSAWMTGAVHSEEGMDWEKGNFAIATISDDWTFVIYDKNGEMLIEINPEKNTATYGKNYTPDLAARRFWEALALMRPCDKSETP